MRAVNSPEGEARRRNAAGRPGRPYPFRPSLASLAQRLLFWLTCAASAGLLGLVLFAPVLAREPRAAPRWLVLFATDAALRRTAVASALGLIVTASIFFRVPPKRNRPRPPGAVGA
jgi:hypothetical protein